MPGPELGQARRTVTTGLCGGGNAELNLSRAPDSLSTDGNSRRLTVIAQTDARLAVVRAKPLHGLLKKHPEWWRHLTVAIGEYADIAANASSDLMIPENERRVVNVSRNTLGTILRSLQDAGLISIGYGKIRPLQPEKLRALVEAG